MKKLLLALTAVAAVVFVALAVVLATLDLNAYKPDIEAAVGKATGRSFEIAGELGLEPALVPTLSVEGVALGNAPWAGEAPMVTAERFELVVRLLPLLSGELSIRRIVLANARVLLETNSAGDANWVFDAPASAPAADAGAGSAPVIGIDELLLEAVTVEFRPADGELQRLRAERLRLTRSADAAALTLELRASVNEVPFTLDGEIPLLRELLANRPFRFDLLGAGAGIELALEGRLEQPLTAPRGTVTLAATVPALDRVPGVGEGAVPAALGLEASGQLVLGDGGEYALEELKLGLGGSDLVFTGRIATAGARPAMRGRLSAGRLDLTPFQPVGEASSMAPAERVFPAEPLALDALRAADVELEIAIDELVTRQLTATAIGAKLRLEDGRLDVTELAAAADGGRIDGTLTLDGRGEQAALSQRLTVRGLALAPLLNGVDGDVASGGRLDLDLALDGRGASVAAIMGSANGRLRLEVRDLTLDSKAAGIASADVLTTALSTFNPLASKESGTRVECAVLNFPIERGRMSNKTGVGMNTPQLSILGGGSIDLATERLDLGVNPKPREGIGLNAAALTDFVRLGGTLAAPKPVTDARGAATAGLKVGAAVATGGLSVLAEGLFDRSGGDVDACAVARGDARLPQASRAASSEPSTLDKARETTGNAVKGAGDAIKGAFKSLFGN